MKSSTTPVFNWRKPGTWKVVRGILNVCPACYSLSYSVLKHIPGLPCECCGLPTETIISKVYQCASCQHTAEVANVQHHEKEDWIHCDFCNPRAGTYLA